MLTNEMYLIMVGAPLPRPRNPHDLAVRLLRRRLVSARRASRTARPE
jgi:hypothetical protein